MEKKSISAVVLAGGNSRRMGQNKALLKLGSKTMIEIVIDKLQTVFQEVIVVTNTPREYPMLKSVHFAKDRLEVEEKSSLVGLYTGIIEASNEYVFAVACDMPLLNIPLIQYMKANLGDEDVFIPHLEGHYQPLHAIYGKGCIEPMAKLLQKEDYKIINFFHEVKVQTLQQETIKQFDPYLQSFINVNNYEEYMKLKTLYF
ncbi:molybdopterin-guanine dinucleotide biosynthesis protein A [Clostridium aceticum]|uniref:Probable molybdenum cofactor guanylyltransferase n=1 Tax=Clostridium aceticum TaxID=84022 RepID=A0A0D8I8W9_9CLOT|nr:molybdenum cofactor guanylyltransferase [Clostridium aceticum]AKL95711.1 molybdopterin-guanine dinucleotide biosynthesis protein A [Clostridium aceticum]KJF26735.1 molybdopterin-guanine dinucleotide biosynthesis protein MobA [Clostridium aceticum]